MRKSAKQRQREKEARVRTIVMAGGGVVAIAVLGIGIFAFAGSSDASTANGCVVGDVSESTQEARREYGDEFARFATSMGLEGSGELCVIFAAADPLAESIVEPLFVGPAESKKGGTEELDDIESKVAVAQKDFEATLGDPTIRERGSAMIEAAVDASQFLEPGDQLLFLSDGIQWTPELQLPKADLTPSGMSTLLTRLEAKGLVPDLEGVEISFPFLLFHPGGLDQAKVRGIIGFWEAWGERAGAEVTVRKPFEL